MTKSDFPKRKIDLQQVTGDLILYRTLNSLGGDVITKIYKDLHRENSVFQIGVGHRPFADKN